jgi:DNA polymerase-1
MPRFSKAKWKLICENFYKKYAGLKAWQDRNIETVIRNDGWLQIPTGRRFKFNKTEVKDGVTWYAENKIKNYPIQGNSGGNILPLACVVIRRGMRRAGLVSKMILTVHDSLVFDVVAEELPKLVKLCTIVGRNLGRYISDYFEVDWNVNLDGECEYGPNYGELKPITEE